MSSQEVSVDDYLCPVCLEVLEEPRKISCTHIFCRACLEGVAGQAGPQQQQSCPVCRLAIDPTLTCTPPQLLHDLATKTATCKNCDSKVRLSGMRQHGKQCTAAASLHTFQPVGATSHPIPQVVNRDTFVCPYCSKANMDCEVLVSHCNARHKHDPRPVVCPVCVSMPWGDPNMTSSNFISHLNARHRFEYHTYVSYDQDDDQMLQAALVASLQQH